MPSPDNGFQSSSACHPAAQRAFAWNKPHQPRCNPQGSVALFSSLSMCPTTSVPSCSLKLLQAVPAKCATTSSRKPLVCRGGPAPPAEWGGMPTQSITRTELQPYRIGTHSPAPLVQPRGATHWLLSGAVWQPDLFQPGAILLQGESPHLNFSLTLLVAYIPFQRLESRGALSPVKRAHDASRTSGCCWEAHVNIWWP